MVKVRCFNDNAYCVMEKKLNYFISHVKLKSHDLIWFSPKLKKVKFPYYYRVFVAYCIFRRGVAYHVWTFQAFYFFYCFVSNKCVSLYWIDNTDKSEVNFFLSLVKPIDMAFIHRVSNGIILSYWNCTHIFVVSNTTFIHFYQFSYFCFISLHNTIHTLNILSRNETPKNKNEHCI